MLRTANYDMSRTPLLPLIRREEFSRGGCRGPGFSRTVTPACAGRKQPQDRAAPLPLDASSARRSRLAAKPRCASDTPIKERWHNRSSDRSARDRVDLPAGTTPYQA